MLKNQAALALLALVLIFSGIIIGIGVVHHPKMDPPTHPNAVGFFDREHSSDFIVSPLVGMLGFIGVVLTIIVAWQMAKEDRDENKRNIDDTNRLSIRPYISIDVCTQDQASAVPASFYTNHMDVAKTTEDGTFYYHNTKPNFCVMRFSNVGEGVAYRLSSISHQRYVSDELFEKGANGSPLYCRVVPNTIILPKCDLLPSNPSAPPTGYDYNDPHRVSFAVDLGPDADEDIKVEFYDLLGNHYEQTFFRFKNKNTPRAYEQKIIRYGSRAPELVPTEAKQ